MHRFVILFINTVYWLNNPDCRKLDNIYNFNSNNLIKYLIIHITYI